MKRAGDELAKPVEEVKRLHLTRHRLCDRSWVDSLRLPSELKATREQFEALWALHPEERGQIKLLGQLVDTPRWQQAYGKPYRFSGMDHAALAVPAEVQPYMTWANTLVEYLAPFGAEARFNMVLLNWYQDGAHYIGWHADDESDMRKNKEGETVVLSVSLGQQRQFALRPKQGQRGESLKLEMPDGCVLVMGGRCQSTHKHSVPKVAGKKGAALQRRINMTFRVFVERK